MKKILMIHTRELCYYSGGFFLNQMAKQLEKQGVQVEQLELSADDASYDQLQSYMGQRYDGVVDINSKLPYLTVDERKGEFWLDQLNAPFYNYILDHPLYHHPGLEFPLRNYHAIGIDREHCAYMKQYYPHLQSIEYLTVAGTPSVVKHPTSKRRIPILFAGSYEPEEVVLDQLHWRGEQIEGLGRAAIAIMLEKRDAKSFDQIGGRKEQNAKPRTEVRTLESVVQELLRADEFHALGEMDFPVLMNQLYPVDKYVRNYRRRTILEGLVECKIPITIMGEGWEQTSLEDSPCVTRLPGRDYARSVEMIADSKVLLDINPLFPCGIHDRVTNAMANHTLCVTNMSPKADIELQHGRDLYYYQQDNVEELAEILNEIMNQKRSCAYEEMTGQAYEAYQNRYSWEAHTKTLLQML